MFPNDPKEVLETLRMKVLRLAEQKMLMEDKFRMTIEGLYMELSNKENENQALRSFAD